MNDLLAARSQMAMSLAFHNLFRIFKGETAVAQADAHLRRHGTRWTKIPE
ncbi:MAG: hypothetical protein QOH25_629 [Acidobacteriota bacterium]|jgi:hypothetical protein|nr:hypothetical protein [Acidobacteriota bacterium]